MRRVLCSAREAFSAGIRKAIIGGIDAAARKKCNRRGRMLWLAGRHEFRLGRDYKKTDERRIMFGKEAKELNDRMRKEFEALPREERRTLIPDRWIVERENVEPSEAQEALRARWAEEDEKVERQRRAKVAKAREKRAMAAMARVGL